MTQDNSSPLRGRHRDKNGEISRKHGNTLMKTLRQTYGKHFAPGFEDGDKLQDVLHALDEHSLSQLVHDHEHGHLDTRLRETGSNREAPVI